MLMNAMKKMTAQRTKGQTKADKVSMMVRGGSKTDSESVLTSDGKVGLERGCPEEGSGLSSLLEEVGSSEGDPLEQVKSSRGLEDEHGNRLLEDQSDLWRRKGERRGKGGV